MMVPIWLSQAKVSSFTKPFGASLFLKIIRMCVCHHIHKEDGVLLILVARLVFLHSLIDGVAEGLELVWSEL